MYAEISSALAGLKTITELAKAAGSMANYGEMLAAVNTVQEKLSMALVSNLASMEKQATQIERITELEAQIVQFKDWSAKSNDYVLQAVGAYKTDFAQVYKPSHQSPQARHWACAKCFQDSKLYVLSADGRQGYKCPNCNNGITPIVPGGTLAPIDSAYE